MKFTTQKLYKYYAEVTPMTGMLPISAHILDPFRKLQLFRKWAKGMDINPEDETSYTTLYQEVFLRCVGNECCAKHRQLCVIQPERIPSSNLFPSAMASGSGQLSFDPYDSSSDDEEYWMLRRVAAMTPGWSDCAMHLLTAARFSLNSPPKSPKNWGQVYVKDYHSHPMEICSTLSIPDITDWWRQQE